jgi:hypothetical protein
MSAEQQQDQTNRRRKRAPKVKSKRGRGGDHTSLRFQREQSQIDSEIYKLICEGFMLSAAASALGVSEERAGVGYRRAISSLRLQTVEESKAAALSRIKRRRTILYAEIEKRRAAVGGDKKKLIDSGDLKMLFDAALALDLREARLVGTDAPLRSLVGWVGVAPSEDLLTTEQLDRLSVDQLRQLHDLLEIARNGHNVAVESHPVHETLNFPTTPNSAPTEAKAAPVAELPAPAPTVSEPTHLPNLVHEEPTNRYAALDHAEETVRQLRNRDPVTRIADQTIRAKMRREANQILIRFGRTPIGED